MIPGANVTEGCAADTVPVNCSWFISWFITSRNTPSNNAPMGKARLFSASSVHLDESTETVTVPRVVSACKARACSVNEVVAPGCKILMPAADTREAKKSSEKLTPGGDCTSQRRV